MEGKVGYSGVVAAARGCRCAGAGALSRRQAVGGAVTPEPRQLFLWKPRQLGMASGNFFMPAGNTLKTRWFLPIFSLRGFRNRKSRLSGFAVRVAACFKM